MTLIPDVRWLVLPLFFAASLPVPAASQPVIWQPWSDQIFVQAAREHKFVLLNLEASWSHWCHAMDQQTYNDPDVSQLLGRSYIAVKVDQSQRPDIANRYRDYDFPATIVLNADGSEIVRKQGFLPPDGMARLLQAIIDDPSPGPSVTPDQTVKYGTTPSLAPKLLAALSENFKNQYEVPDQLSDFGARYLDADSLEYASDLARQGDKPQEHRVLDDLKAGELLLDPVWGGAFQSLVVATVSRDAIPGSRFIRIQFAGYLDPSGDNWNDPHYEKTLFTQAQVIRMYAKAYNQWHIPEQLATAQSVDRYVREFLTSSDGAFYVGQDSDIEGTESTSYFAMNDDKRRALGIPLVDQHLYARENGWMIEALCTLYSANHDPSVLQAAERSANWVIAHRSLEGGGFSHDEHDPAGPFLGDSLAVGQGFFALFQATGDRQWLDRAEGTAHFISTNFSDEAGAGFFSSTQPMDPAYKPHPDRNENAQMARFTALLAQYTGNAGDREMSASAMRYLATPEIASAGFSAPVLLAEMEFAIQK